MDILSEGIYNIPDDCTVHYTNRQVYVSKMKRKPEPNIKKCCRCIHQKRGKVCMRNQFWESFYCELKPKTIAGKTEYFYGAPDYKPACEKFESKK